MVFVSGVQYTTSGTDMRSADDKTKFSASAAPRDNETTLASLSYEANPSAPSRASYTAKNTRAASST